MIHIGGNYDEIMSFEKLINVIKQNKKNNGDVCQIYLGKLNSTTTSTKQKLYLTDKEIKEIKQELGKTMLFVHATLTLNLTVPFKGDHFNRYRWHYLNLLYDLQLSEKLGVKAVVIHLGSMNYDKKTLTETQAINNYVHHIVEALNDTSNYKTMILIETNAGQISKIGNSIKTMYNIYLKIKKKLKNNKNINRLGFCIDTCHIFTAGEPIDTPIGMQDYLDRFNKIIGLNKVGLIHLNDSKKELGSRIDRHETLGEGYIFSKTIDNLRVLLQYMKKYNIPAVLETPNYNLYKDEIELVRKLSNKIGGNIKQNIDNLYDLALLYKLLGDENRSRVYMNAWKIVKKYMTNNDKKSLNQSNIDYLDKISGIGKSVKEKLEEIIETGHIYQREELLKNVNMSEKEFKLYKKYEGVMGVGSQKALAWVKQGMPSKNELTKMQKIGLKYYDDLQIPITRKEAEKWKEIIEKIIESNDVLLGGSYLMGKSVINDIDIMIIVSSEEDIEPMMTKVIEGLKENNMWKDGIEKSGLAIVSDNKKIYHMDIRVVPRDSLGSYLLYFGSGEQFSRKIRLFAKRKGYKLNQWGLYKNNKKIAGKDEKEIFEILNIPYIKPKNRTDISKIK